MDPTRWLKRSAHGFSELSREERRAIKEFALLWSFYEAKVLNCNGSVGAIVGSVAELHSQGRLYLEPFSPAISHFRQRYWDGAQFTYAFEQLLFRPRDRRPHVESIIRGALTAPADVLSAILIIVYRLRNNLFHGPKWTYGIHGQLQNFRHANDVLMLTMEMHGL
jgi:hypothetical protein